MAEEAGFEPTTTESKSVELPLLHSSILAGESGLEPEIPGAEPSTLPITSLANVWSERHDLNVRPSDPKSDVLPNCTTPRNGGPDEIRTHYFVLARDALYQLSYKPIIFLLFILHIYIIIYFLKNQLKTRHIWVFS